MDASFEKPVHFSVFQKTYVQPLNVVADRESSPWIKTRSAHVDYDELKYQAMYHCKNSKNPSEKTSKLIDKLILVEKKYKVPPSLRGMLLAAACTESGFNPFARGDYRKSKKTGKKKPKAIGLLQQWPWVVKFYKIDRKNPLQAAEAWMSHVVRQLKSVKKECRPHNARALWVAAWVKSIRAPKKNGNRCNERPTHYRLLRKWHKNIMHDREATERCDC